jgi:hypothetical protein
MKTSGSRAIDVTRRWTAGVLLAATVGAGVVGVHLATDASPVAASTTGSSSSSGSADSSSAQTTTSGS